MKHADFIIVSWILSFVPIALYAWRIARQARRLDPFVDEGDKPWT
ncbi:MAG: hypothetical protein RIQ64_817 [Actinomycetota bacterium]|jgi:hypothetical protein